MTQKQHASDARVGDTVRLRITTILDGVVEKLPSGKLIVDGIGLDVPGCYVEILKRALPTEPGYYLAEKEAYNVGVLQLTGSMIWWWIGNKHKPRPVILTLDEARAYGPLTPLVAKS